MRILIESHATTQDDLKLATSKEKDLTEIYNRIFTSNDGIMIFEDLANMSGMYRSNFVADNNKHTAYLEEQRALFLYICSKLENNTINVEGDL